MKSGDVVTVYIWKKPRTGVLIEPPPSKYGLWKVFWYDGKVEMISSTVLNLASTTIV